MFKRATLFALLCSTGLAGCEDGGGAAGVTPDVPYTAFFTPLPTQAVFPATNEFSEEKRALGEFLFWDPILSGRMNVACATCHHPDHGWADGRPRSIGVDGEGLGPNREGILATHFHSPTILNVAFTGLERTPVGGDFSAGAYFWDLRALTLEAQAIEPIKNELEMRSTDFLEAEIMPEIVDRLSLIFEYRELFSSAFGDPDPINEDNIAKALATYERTLTTQPTRFDQFLAGNESALSEREVTGLNKFINGGCVDCHSGPMLSDNSIDATKVVQREKRAVRTPGLRNVELTAPYMHDGSVPRLRGAVSIYEDRGDLEVTLEEDDFGDIEAFLRTLTDADYPKQIPAYVPSQLPVGGNIQ
ncbi:MAG: cytochrome c peroxidase [Pseudomonadota bacterium]